MSRPRNQPGNPFEPSKPGKIKVNSKTYGTHFRAPRGSVTEAKLNETMQEVNKLTLSTNAPAKLIHDALKPFRENFKGGLFYQRLQKHFNVQARKGQIFDITDLLSHSPKVIEKMQKSRYANEAKDKWWLRQLPEDINKNYPQTRMFETINVHVNADMPNLSMQLSVMHKLAPKFLSERPYLDGVQFTFILLFPDFVDDDISVESIVLPVRKLDDADIYSFMMNIPVTASAYMLFWKAEGTEGEIVKAGPVSKSMVLHRVGKL